MPITYKSDGPINREVIKNHLRSKKNMSRDFKVLDIGGSANPWCDEFVDAYLDVVPFGSKKIFLGDIYNEEIWNEIRKEKWDFCVCTHTLEDLRDPKFVVDRIQQIFKEGFISVPNKHTELSNVESRDYLGYGHHRWIFQITTDDRFRAIAKMPLINCFNKYNKFQRLQHKIRKIARFFRGKVIDNLPRSINWLQRNKASHNNELGFLWEDDFPFDYINGDFAGKNLGELVSLYMNELKDGL